MKYSDEIEQKCASFVTKNNYLFKKYLIIHMSYVYNVHGIYLIIFNNFK